ncbi:MAG: hypothetical protein KAS04_01905, partial [Candidatus Aenigmarchaeota archaeon]|nr:hypothetical protein [Candidatus Aenigmarchaeota archaeon]
DMQSSLNEIKDETDVRIDRIKEQIRVVEKIPTINDKVDGLIEKMSPGNIEKLKKFIFTADEITGDIIPNEVEKRLTKQMTPFFNDLKDIRDDIEKVTENIKSIFNEINYFKGEVKTLYKFGEYITELQTEKDKMYDKMNEKEMNLLKMVAKLEDLIKKRTDTYYEKINNFEKKFANKLEDNVKDCFDDLTYSKFKELEDKTENHLAVSRAKINDMLSKFVQFQNVVNPTMAMVKEQIETLNMKSEKIKDRQSDLEEETVDTVKDTFNEIAVPEIKKAIDGTERLKENVNGKLDDFEAEFVQYQNVINPTLGLLKNDLSKMDNKFEKMKVKQENNKESINDLKSLRKSMEAMMAGMKSFELKQGEIEKNIMLIGTKMGELQEEFDNTLKQSMIDKKKLDDQSKKQKDRVNILLKELKS